MPQHSKHILVVEGEADRSFFEEFCRQLGLDAKVQVAEPRALHASAYNSKNGLFNLLGQLLKQLEDGHIESLAAVVDADAKAHGGGFQSTVVQASTVLQPFGYTLISSQHGGLIYSHDDGLADFGLWVMPDNASDGMLEDWLKQCAAPAEQALLARAVSIVGSLPQPTKFKPLHLSKAEVATWLAWQKTPGQGLHLSVRDQLLDTGCLEYMKLSAWLAHVFKP